MRSPRLALIILSIVFGLALVPAAALAAGPSAGDQQYVDPLGGSSGTTSTGSPSSSPSSSSSSASSSATGTSASGATAAPTASPPAAAATAAPTSTPTPTTTSDPATPSRTLPFTGFTAWQAALIGVAFLCGGAILRRRVISR